MKIKIIDLLNKIANNEQPPKKIMFINKVLEYDEDVNDYFGIEYGYLFERIMLSKMLNDEVEILETTITYNGVQGCIEVNNKIEKIPIKDMKIQATSTNNYCYSISQPMKIIINKINEIIERINKL